GAWLRLVSERRLHPGDLPVDLPVVGAEGDAAPLQAADVPQGRPAPQPGEAVVVRGHHLEEPKDVVPAPGPRAHVVQQVPQPVPVMESGWSLRAHGYSLRACIRTRRRAGACCGPGPSGLLSPRAAATTEQPSGARATGVPPAPENRQARQTFGPMRPRP